MGNLKGPSTQTQPLLAPTGGIQVSLNVEALWATSRANTFELRAVLTVRTHNL
jgi:hypothetical protein